MRIRETPLLIRVRATDDLLTVAPSSCHGFLLPCCRLDKVSRELGGGVLLAHTPFARFFRSRAFDAVSR